MRKPRVPIAKDTTGGRGSSASNKEARWSTVPSPPSVIAKSTSVVVLVWWWCSVVVVVMMWWWCGGGVVCQCMIGILPTYTIHLQQYYTIYPLHIHRHICIYTYKNPPPPYLVSHQMLHTVETPFLQLDALQALAIPAVPTCYT